MSLVTALDEYQLPFAQDSRRALRLLAPAGSGKTHSLLWRCLHQWQAAKKSKPRFLLFAFTRAARDEMSDRLRTVAAFEPIRGSVEVSTLNSWGYRRLKSRTHSLRLLTGKQDLFWAINNNLQPVWTKHDRLRDLLTQTTSRNRTANALISVMDGLKSLGFRHDTHHTAAKFDEHMKWLRSLGLVTYLTNLLQSLHDLQIVDLDSKTLAADLERRFLKFWREATISLRDMAMITLEDQKYWAWLDLEEAIAGKKYTTGVHRYDHVMVDEFQDVNCLDLKLLQAIAEVNKSQLTLIGDDDQAIYEWRGASPEFILKPEVHISSDYATHILNCNYRSPRNVVQLSQKLIKHNKRRVDKDIRPHSKTDAKIDVISMPSITASTDYVVSEVTSMLKDKSIKKVAIIGRKRGQIIPYQIAFASRNIPFYAAEDLHVFLSEAFGELKDMLAIKARADAGPIPGLDPIADTIKLVDKIKRYPLSKPDRTALQKHLQTERPRTFEKCIESLRRYTGPLKGNNDDASRSNSFADDLLALAKSTTVSDAISTISERFDGLQKDYGKSLEDIFYSDPPFLHLAEYAEKYGTDYTAFYEDLDKAIATLARLPGEEEDEKSTKEPEWKLPLHLLTALRAKGKEYDAVIILDANSEIWPSKLATTPDQLEQERRVFYVAFTRVRQRLIMLVNESLLGKPAAPSPYLEEMGLKSKALRPR
jgi:DNA helicase-2/ATP-dependent DNA helicase PcrA